MELGAGIAGVAGAKLPRAFYERPVLAVARASLGMILVHDSPGGLVAGRIVETEAYRGPEDLAAHSAGGRRTARTEVMFGQAGHAYLFRLYGMHWAFNVVCGAPGQPHAVLVRAVEPLVGLELMMARRGADRVRRELTGGPGRLCAALGLTGEAYGVDLCGDALFLAEPAAPRRVVVGRSPRINVDYAGAWADKPWRFYEKGNPFVSVPPRN